MAKKESKTETITIRLDAESKKKIELYATLKGYKSTTSFFKELTMNIIEENAETLQKASDLKKSLK